MYHFAAILIAGIVAAVLGSSVAFMPTPARAAKLSNAERIALEKATAACKVEAKGMKFSWHWRKRQKYVQNCIIRRANKESVRIDIWQIRRAVNMKGLRPQRAGEWGCDPSVEHARAARDQVRRGSRVGCDRLLMLFP